MNGELSAEGREKPLLQSEHQAVGRVASEVSKSLLSADCCLAGSEWGAGEKPGAWQMQESWSREERGVFRENNSEDCSSWTEAATS